MGFLLFLLILMLTPHVWVTVCSVSQSLLSNYIKRHKPKCTLHCLTIPVSPSPNLPNFSQPVTVLQRKSYGWYMKAIASTCSFPFDQILQFNIINLCAFIKAPKFWLCYLQDTLTVLEIFEPGHIAIGAREWEDSCRAGKWMTCRSVRYVHLIAPAFAFPHL